MTATGPVAAPAGAIPRLAVAVRDAAPLEHAAAPAIRFALDVEAAGGAPGRSILLDVQGQIAARRRGYDAEDQPRLFELFGAPADWGTTLRTLLWARTTLVVAPFTGAT